MVSLSRDFNTSTGGGVFFSESLNDDDTRQLHPVVGEDSGRKFQPLETVPVVILLLSLSVCVVILAIVLAAVWPEELDRCAPFFIILYIHAAFWCTSLIVDNHIKIKHHILRINGYLDFYRQVQVHSRIPFYVVSFWNAILLVLSTVYQHVYEDFREQCKTMGFMKPVYPLCVAIGTEAVILIFVIAMYTRKVVEFNRSKPPPDVLREEWMISFIQDSYSGGEIGYRDPGDHIHDLLEKQADLIRYLVDRNAKLSQKIMLLSSRINGEHS